MQACAGSPAPVPRGCRNGESEVDPIEEQEDRTDVRVGAKFGCTGLSSNIELLRM